MKNWRHLATSRAPETIARKMRRLCTFDRHHIVSPVSCKISQRRVECLQGRRPGLRMPVESRREITVDYRLKISEALISGNDVNSTNAI